MYKLGLPVLSIYQYLISILIFGSIQPLPGFTVSRTFESPSFTVSVCVAVVLAWELQDTGIRVSVSAQPGM